MTDLALGLAAVVAAVSTGVSGILLVPTRSRTAGVLLMVGAAGVLVSVALFFADARDAAEVTVTASVALVMAMALLAYPRASVRHAVEYCAWAVVVAAGLITTAWAFDPSTTLTMSAVIGTTVVGHAWWAADTGDEADRQAVLWLALGAGTTGLLLLLLGLVFGAVGGFVGILLLAVVGPTMVIGVRRPSLADVRSLLVEAVVFGVIVLAYVSAFVGVLGVFSMFGWTEPSEGAYAFLGAALAVGFHPLRVVLRGLIDELLFGDRPDPLAAASSVADRIGDDPVLALRAIREALVLPYAAISVDGEELATSGTQVTDTRRFALSLGSDSTGELVVGLRPGDLTLPAGDAQVLQIVAPLLAQTLRASALSEELKESRGAAIAAIEEERRRLRRDLHDGLGPTLSGIALTADAARNTIASDPAGADALLRGLRADAAAAVGDIRRLVYAMRPPALDELGLVPALRQQVASARTADGRPMQVTVAAPELPQLPAAVEVAAYRIATEAVTNSARHSGTDRAWVRLERDGDLLGLTVRDEGAAQREWVAGVGLSSMRERAAEVGGTLEVTTDERGSLVTALLPLG
ncbi:MAG: histidine kinase [Acidimicrobiales bacterium]|nr:histidine kinase [Acidimicrobiales bacterium]